MKSKTLELPQFVSAWRFRQTSQSGRTLGVEASSDRSRIVFCEAFRQLHRKAQVFSLEESGSARTRLTHSLEVAQLGRYLTQLIFESAPSNVLAEHKLTNLNEVTQSFVESACLVHDIGNPPFGHFGELAIRHWFERHHERLEKAWCNGGRKKRDLFQTYMKDFIEFDGSPQGFRILTRLMWATDEHGLNLTCTQLASAIKYNIPPNDVTPSDPIRKKPGYFHSEQDIASKICNQLNILPGRRHPFSYIMEAADDIAYCLSDIEDAINKDLVSESSFLDEIASKVIDDQEFSDYAKFLPKKVNGQHEMGAYLHFRIRCINHIVALAAKEFIDFHAEYIEGIRSPILDNIQSARALLEHIKSVARSKIYNSSIVLRNELVGAKVITGILDSYLPILLATRDRFESALSGAHKDKDGNHISSEKALILQIPPNLLRAYKFAAQQKVGDDMHELFCRAHLIMDYLTGLTDGQAVAAHKLLCAG